MEQQFETRKSMSRLSKQEDASSTPEKKVLTEATY
jgi:hypothetical protein